MLTTDRALVLWRWVYTKGRTLKQIQSNLSPVLTFMWPLILRQIGQQAYGQGMGRHSEAEVLEIGVRDLRALSTYLGKYAQLVST